MITSIIQGGLGNQMFQYAAGKSLSVRRNTELRLDISWYQKYNLRKFNLSHFNINASIESSDATMNVKPSLKLSNIFSGKNKGEMNHIYREKDMSFDPNVLSLPDNSYLFGNWQHENYFIEIRDLLLKEFNPIIEPSGLNSKLLQKILEVDSIGIHIRRGDYASNRKALSFHGLCSLEYYNQAIALLTEKLHSPELFIFSDEPDWAEKNLITDFPVTVMRHNINREWEDLRLMKACKHQIIANSSFSWWAAWLNTNPGKTVIAPENWFRDQKQNRYTSGIIPVGWFKIQN
jgi:hypothetical protein